MTYNPLISLRKANAVLEWALMHNYIAAKLEDVSRNITRMLLGPDPDSLSYSKFVESSVIPVPVKSSVEPPPFTEPAQNNIPTEADLTPVYLEGNQDPMARLQDYFTKYFSSQNIAGNSQKISKVFAKFINYFQTEEKNDGKPVDPVSRDLASEEESPGKNYCF